MEIEPIAPAPPRLTDSERTELVVTAVAGFLDHPDIREKLADVRGLVTLVHGEGVPLRVSTEPARLKVDVERIFMLEGRELATAWCDLTKSWHKGGNDGPNVPDLRSHFLDTLGIASGVLLKEYDNEVELLGELACRLHGSTQRDAAQRGLSLDAMRWDTCTMVLQHLARRSRAFPSPADVLAGLGIGRDPNDPLAANHRVVADLATLAHRPPEGVDPAALPFRPLLTQWRVQLALATEFVERMRSIFSYPPIEPSDLERAKTLAFALVQLGQLAARPLSELEAMRRIAASAWRDAEARNRADPWVTVMRPEIRAGESYESATGATVVKEKVAEEHTRVRESEAAELKPQYAALRRELRTQVTLRNAALPQPRPPSRAEKAAEKAREAERLDPAKALLAQARRLGR